MSKLLYLIAFLSIYSCGGVSNSNDKKAAHQNTNDSFYKEPHRPQIHFSPREKWMNDPNGMVYHNGTYHLMYQYYPDSTVWGPMHWGHATSQDLVHWQHQPIALYPDSLGYIFSGSTVADVANTSGFGKDGKTPLVAIFTHHHPDGEKSGSTTYQNQSIAYSLDDGKTWTKYAGNPVIKNPGIKDFRDPKVMWYEAGKAWIMTLATLDRITFYSSKDLKNWVKETEFGQNIGAHGGVWECPDLFILEHEGKKVWVLLVSINPGGPNGGSATQYFTGQFDGKKFTPYQTDIRWIDYGPDNYAGVTWFGTGNRKIFMGWMGNWLYAQAVPTEKWRSAMTIPRDLGLQRVGEKYLVTSKPVQELATLENNMKEVGSIDGMNYNLTNTIGKLQGPTQIRISSEKIEPFTCTLSNAAGEKVTLGFDAIKNQYFMDRTQSGKVSFEKNFAARHTAPRLTAEQKMDMTLIIANASIELFADHGLSVMTQTFFPNQPFTDIQFISPNKFRIDSLEASQLKSIWK